MYHYLILHWGGGLYAAWTCVSLFVILLALTFLVPFRRGTWKSKRVIETAPPAISEGFSSFPPLDGKGSRKDGG